MISQIRHNIAVKKVFLIVRASHTMKAWSMWHAIGVFVIVGLSTDHVRLGKPWYKDEVNLSKEGGGVTSLP